MIRDRVAGVMVGTACGDALGVPYEFATAPGPDQLAEMLGGGLGDFAPGEWSDDTSMAVAILEVAATGADLTTVPASDRIAEGFLRWYDGGPADIGIQTNALLSRTRARLEAGETGPARVSWEEAAAYTLEHEHSAGNGALMRTAPVALAHLHERDRCAAAARSVAALTHADPLAGDSCVLWSEAIRVAVLEERIDVRSGLDLVPESRRDQWAGWLDEAEEGPAERFRPNGFTVTALQAAYAAILSTHSDSPAALQDALHAAVRIGDDTDTVAAIAGGLVGARWGLAAIPAEWRAAVHGWPGRTADDLVDLAERAARVDVVSVARAIATEAHAGQVDKSGAPYITHPARVARRVEEYGAAAVAVAWLHDVLEDCPITAADLLARGLPAEVVVGVEAMTKQEGEEHAAAVARACADDLGRIVKAADVADNADPARQALLPAADRERLTAKYVRAREVLDAHGAPRFE